MRPMLISKPLSCQFILERVGVTSRTDIGMYDATSHGAGPVLSCLGRSVLIGLAHCDRESMREEVGMKDNKKVRAI